jgi:uncharacterized protein YgbK (DUF1537 family)
VKPLLSYYGDDLTGSTDVMEALELRGIPTVLFAGIPAPEVAARFAGHRAVGIAGTSRSETPEWMDAHLPAVFAWLKARDAEICHYKVCSTFDSSPTVGSIGRALDIGANIFGQASTPLVVGAPELRRYTAFGNLFAAFRGDNHRIDRHPVMSRHPVTPMHEADLRLHLARQTDKLVGLVDLVRVKHGISAEELDTVFAAFPIVLLDVLDMETQRIVGSHLWRRRKLSPFVVGSSGVEYALTAEGADTPLAGRRHQFDRPGTRGPIAVVSGSCSPTTERQIRYAETRGFAGIALDAAALATDNAAGEIDRAVAAGAEALQSGRSPLLYTALGGQTPGTDLKGRDHLIGIGLGRILDTLVRRFALGRAVVAGGDTSSHAIAELGIEALECRIPLAPGSPLCTAHRRDGGAIEIAFKGGQVGDDDYFVLARDI